jgi:hypothetical protein
MLTTSIWTCVSAATVFLLLLWIVGWGLVPSGMVRGDELWSVALRIGSGLLFLSGVSATWFCGRFCYATLIPLIQVWVLSGWLWRGKREPVERGGWRLLATLSVVWLCCVGFTSWQYDWELRDGVRALHGDLGYMVQHVMGFPEAAASSQWAATMGEAAVEGGTTVDIWYHWLPVWLGALIVKMTGLPGMVVLYRVLVAVLSFELVLLAAVMVRTLAGMSLGASLLTGAASIMGVQWIKMFGVLWMGEWLPWGTLQHSRLSLIGHFMYQCEGVVVLMTLAAWQQRQTWLALCLLYFAGLSSPHNVAALGVAAGTMLVLGAGMRRRELCKSAFVMIVTLLAAWGTLRFVFYVDLPKAAGQPLLVLDWRVLLGRFRAGVLDAGFGLGLEALLLPGLIYLVRQRDKNSRAAELGWLALSALVGSYLAFHLLRHVSDGFHFTMLSHAVLVMPVSIWGLSCLCVSPGAKRVLCSGIIILSTLMGMHDVWHARSHEKALPYATEDMQAVKKALAGKPFGYFAHADRPWWISKHSTLAAFLESRCIRLNEITGVEGDHHSHYYGATRPHELVPRRSGEEPLDWSLRLAQRLSVRNVVEIEAEALPERLQQHLKLIYAGKTLRLYELTHDITNPAKSALEHLQQ